MHSTGLPYKKSNGRECNIRNPPSFWWRIFSRGRPSKKSAVKIQRRLIKCVLYWRTLRIVPLLQSKPTGIIRAMIKTTQGNLLKAPAEALVNTVNTVGVMGKGIALQFRQAFPEMFRAYEKACKDGDMQLGQVQVVDLGGVGGGPRWIINFPTKGHWRANSRLSDVENGLADLVERCASS